MTRLLSLKSLSLVLAGTLVMTSPLVAAHAADKSVDANKVVKITEPDPAKIPSIANMMKNGVKPYYLGQRSNTDGWFLLKDGQMQIVYVPVGTTDAILGAMFDEKGQNVTGPQVSELMKRHPEIAAEMTAAAAQAEQQSAPVAPADNASPGEKLLKELDGTTNVVVGDASAPLVDMVMDADCKHCQASWKVMREAVMGKKLRLRLIPIANPGTDNERAGGVLLHAADPLTAWDKHVGGDASALAGTPDQATRDAVKANHILIDKWNIDVTPYFVYRSKAGSVKIIRGEIKADHLNDLLTDITP